MNPVRKAEPKLMGSFGSAFFHHFVFLTFLAKHIDILTKKGYYKNCS